MRQALLASVLAGAQSRRTLVITADLALCKLMQQQLARLADRFDSGHFAAETAKLHQPFAKIVRQLRVQFFTKPLRKGRAFAGSRNGNLQISTANDRRKIKIAERWIVDRIAKNVRSRSLRKYRAIHRRGRRPGNNEKRPREIASLILTLMPRQFT